MLPYTESTSETHLDYEILLEMDVKIERVFFYKKT